MEAIKNLIPKPIKEPLKHLRQMFTYKHYDSSEYWRKRASKPNQAAVLWKNQEYNDLYRVDQRTIIEPWVRSLPSGACVLDIGCGIGVVAGMINSIRQDITIDAVDFEEMIAVAREKNSKPGIRYIASPAEEFERDDIRYDLIISSACYSAIRDIDHLKKSLNNGARMLMPGGVMLMIDPFHRWNYLARAKFGTKDVIAHLKPHNMRLLEKSGILFWPYRVRLANSTVHGQELKAKYQIGEKLLKRLGSHFWADYKVLAFRKQS
ncbi:MAG: class I SAM-dependent methyltransferase [Mesorhizobium sp.]